MSKRRSAPVTRMTCNGRFTSRTRADDPLPIARQKKSVAEVPNRLAVGTV
jgi:hypothetical protein